MRTTIYLGETAAARLDEITRTYLERYSTAITTSAVFARLLAGETVDDILERPFSPDLEAVTLALKELRQQLQAAVKSSDAAELHRVHRETAKLFARTSTITNVLRSARKGRGPFSPNYSRAAEVETEIHGLMDACAKGIMARGRRT